MNEDERLYEQYEDAFFALLMNRVAEANGKELMQKNEELLADPNAAVPESLSKRCLHTIEKSYRKAQIQKAAKKILNISINAAYNLIHSKSFPVIRIGNSFRVPKEPFYEWMKSSHTIMN